MVTHRKPPKKHLNVCESVWKRGKLNNKSTTTTVFKASVEKILKAFESVIMSNKLPLHPPCKDPLLYGSGKNVAEQITDELNTCHYCHKAAYSGRHRILVKCGHILCEDCFIILLRPNDNNNNNDDINFNKSYIINNNNSNYTSSKFFLASNCSDHSKLPSPQQQQQQPTKDQKVLITCPLCHLTDSFPVRRLNKMAANSASEAMADRLLRRHNRANGALNTFYDIRDYRVDPVRGKAAF
ncbi:hypothetical protein HELRODRAFT_183657 [Helobdella robusta]|uniref:RING-type domain-containing protein n=1 Tax=Helobdella robusta TaxID=6412 RepID=T1FK02_HELRO|nr:hypothetical protein HELRODRAFT_183657 [Helobdella robusta]ESO10435.1 hypothetical protein HELRODRAFT_183657 [Helobdella robusta]